MADEDAQGGTTGGEGGQSTSTGTADANVAELQAKVAEYEAKIGQSLAEKTGYEETKRKLSEAQQMLAQVMSERETGAPPTTGSRSGPFAAIDAELDQLEQIRSKYPNDPLTLRAIRDAQREREALQWELTKERAWATIASVRPDDLRDRAWQMFLTGAFANPEAAVYAAKGASSIEEEQARLNEEAKRKAASKPSTGVADSGGSVAGAKPMSGSEYVKTLRDKAGTAEAHKLIADYDAGRVPVDWSR